MFHERFWIYLNRRAKRKGIAPSHHEKSFYLRCTFESLYSATFLENITNIVIYIQQNTIVTRNAFSEPTERRIPPLQMCELNRYESEKGRQGGKLTSCLLLIDFLGNPQPLLLSMLLRCIASENSCVEYLRRRWPSH